MRYFLHLSWIIAATVLFAAPSMAQRRESGGSRSSSSSGSSSAPSGTRSDRSAPPSTPVHSREDRTATPPARTEPRETRTTTTTPPASTPTSSVPSGPGVSIDADVPAGAFVDAWAGPSPETDEEDSKFVLWDVGSDPQLAAFDFSDASRCPSDDPQADIVYTVRANNGWMDVSRDTDIRDVTSVEFDPGHPGSTEWSIDHSVQLYDGHTYIVWTWDDELYQFTVHGITPLRIQCTWAQVDKANHFHTGGIARNGLSKPAFHRTNFPP